LACRNPRRAIELVTDVPDGTFAAVGWRQGGIRAAALAASQPPQVDRLVLCCVPIPTDESAFDVGAITAKTLLIYGQLDPEAPFRHARWWKDNLRDARIEMVPGRGSDIIDVMWKRICAHAAPHTLRSRR
jgi:pimeloyl-ACP methyl ester carboxylesterase